MLEPQTNFAFLMDLLGARPVDICKATGADKTQVSRWRSGKRRLMPNHHWVTEIADCFLLADKKLPRPVIFEVLRVYYPSESLDTPEQLRDALTRWLSTSEQRHAAYGKQREGLLGRILSKISALEPSEPEPYANSAVPEPAPFAENTVVYGVKGAQASTLQAAELVLNMTEPQEILFICPEGLDIYTRDPKFAPKLMDVLMQLFAAGHRMSVVLRTDYRMTDVSAFSGRWLVAHLLGYVRSYYFDEFHKTYADKMMAVVGGRMAYKVRNVGPHICTTLHFDKPTVDSILTACEGYRSKSKQRFHYGLFERPDGFLGGVKPLPDRAHYQLARMPYFCLAEHEAFQAGFQLSDVEMTLMLREFSPLLCYPGMFGDAPVRHIFCEDNIKAALSKSRHVSPELSAITGRRVNMTTPRLTDQLARIKHLLTACPNYEVCFLPDSVFKKLSIQIAAWGDSAAIGWISDGNSAACRDYTNCNALTGFCGMVWDQIPKPLRSRRMAFRKLKTWLKAAKKGKEGS